MNGLKGVKFNEVGGIDLKNGQLQKMQCDMKNLMETVMGFQKSIVRS